MTDRVARRLVRLLPEEQAEEGEGHAADQRREGEQRDGMHRAYRGRDETRTKGLVNERAHETRPTDSLRQ